ncbi:MAG: sterol desaturase/sphingolipid hydroxylase (fatty acid hydroxylase superfamily) [Bacteriovoracaceae bacterium]|jgi:sterol desaturase/sphingolipid hydroxylase (fatty acid hydroxylase superfamily)
MNEGLIRPLIFLLSLLTIGFLEASFEYRNRLKKRSERWPSNISIIVLGTILVKFVFPMGAVGVAYWCEVNNFGIFNWMGLSYIPKVILTIIFLDLVIYYQHILTHKIPFLWKFHQVHHSDRDLDITSALRFHPVEIILSMMLKSMVISLMGADPKGVLVFELILSSMAIFNHANLYIHPRVEKLLRYVFVTPQMHIIHHSEERYESDSNYGFNFSFWDRIFKTYTESWKSKKIIGQRMYQRDKDQELLSLLKQPFIK